MLPLVIRELESVARAADWSAAVLGERLGFGRSWLSNLRSGRPLSTLALSRISTGFGDRPRVRDLVWHYLTVELPHSAEGTPSEARLLAQLPPAAQRTLQDYVTHFPFEHLAGRGLLLVSRVPRRLSEAARYLVAANEARGVSVLRLLPRAEGADRHSVLATHLLLVERFDEATPAVRDLVYERLLIHRPVVATVTGAHPSSDAPDLRRALRGATDRVSLDTSTSASPRLSSSETPE